MPTRLKILAEKFVITFVGLTFIFLFNFGSSLFFERRSTPSEVKTEEQFEEQLGSVFQTLEKNSQQATLLLTRLQNEVTRRNNAMQEAEAKLQELQQQRTLLELTSEQRQAIEGLVRRPQSARDIFTSLDFWLGRFALSTGFFVLGLLVSRWRK